MPRIVLLLFIGLCAGESIKESQHVIVIPSSVPSGHVGSLPNEGFTQYQVVALSNGNNANRFKIDLDGRIYLRSAVRDLIGESITVPVNVRNVITDSKSLHHFAFKITDELEPSYYEHDRRKRAIEVSIAKQVNETVSEITLDYGTAGVVKNVNNRYYMADGGDTPLTVDSVSGRLVLLDSARRLDYETAPNRRYNLIVYVNNSLSNIGMYTVLSGHIYRTYSILHTGSVFQLLV